MNTGNPYVCDQEKLYQVDSIPQGIKRITHYVKKNGKESTFNNRKYYVDIDNGKVYRHHGTILFTCHPFTNTKATVIIDDNNENVHLYNGSKLKKYMDEEVETY